MGNFLAAPITEKETTRGEGNGLVYGVSAMQGWRANMEDSHVAVTVDTAAAATAAGLPEGCSVFAVCDGHGGKFTADMAAQIMVEQFAATMKERALFTAGASAVTGKEMPSVSDLSAALRDAYMALDARIRKTPEMQHDLDQSGCTAISALITNAHLLVINSGDSRSVLAKDGATVPMSFDHKPNNEMERLRIEKAGGIVRSNRVNGDLAVSRALGDFTYKQRDDLSAEEQQVSAEPDIKVEPRTGTEEFLVIACDGIWDVMSNDDACNHVRMLMNKGEKDMGLIAEDLLDVCLKMGSRDNMSAVIVKFAGAKIGEGEGVLGLRRERERLEEEARKDEEAEFDEKDFDEQAQHPSLT